MLGILKAKMALISPNWNFYIGFYLHIITFEFEKKCDIEIDVHVEKNYSVILILAAFIL